MSDNLVIRPVVSASGEIRRASSSCCGAKLSAAGRSRGDSIPLDGAPGWLCRECGQQCSLVLSEPEKVILNG
jgi:hypothetical protein